MFIGFVISCPGPKDVYSDAKLSATAATTFNFFYLGISILHFYAIFPIQRSNLILVPSTYYNGANHPPSCKVESQTFIGILLMRYVIEE